MLVSGGTPFRGRGGAALLAFERSSLLVWQLLVGHTPDMFPNSADRIGIVVGFSSGDSIRLGEVTEDGLLLLAKAEE